MLRGHGHLDEEHDDTMFAGEAEDFADGRGESFLLLHDGGASLGEGGDVAGFECGKIRDPAEAIYFVMGHADLAEAAAEQFDFAPERGAFGEHGDAGDDAHLPGLKTGAGRVEGGGFVGVVVGEGAVADEVVPIAVDGAVELVVEEAVDEVFHIGRMFEGVFQDQVMFNGSGGAKTEVDGGEGWGMVLRVCDGGFNNRRFVPPHPGPRPWGEGVSQPTVG